MKLGDLSDQLPGFLGTDEEIQVVFFVALCGLGFWVLLCWFIQVLRSILWIIWPLLFVGIFLALMPSFRTSLTQQIIPQRIDKIMHLIDKNTYGYNTTDVYWHPHNMQ